jgi:hypothetical protein
VPKVDVPTSVDPADAAEPVPETVEETVPPVVDELEETVGEVGDTTGQVPEPPSEPIQDAAPELVP